MEQMQVLPRRPLFDANKIGHPDHSRNFTPNFVQVSAKYFSCSSYMHISRIVTIGHDFSKGPIKEGCRKSLIAIMYKLNAYVFVFVAGIFTSNRKQDVDYSFYLGKDYKSTMKPIKKVSTMLCNHVSWLDT